MICPAPPWPVENSLAQRAGTPLIRKNIFSSEYAYKKGRVNGKCQLLHGIMHDIRAAICVELCWAMLSDQVKLLGRHKLDPLIITRKFWVQA